MARIQVLAPVDLDVDAPPVEKRIDAGEPGRE
jgi:hypothetical protein